VPAAAIAGRVLASRGNTPRATKILQRTWSRAPHPDLATAYAYARIGDSPRDRLDRVRQLAALSPNSIESPIAVASAAIEAHQFDEARAALEPLIPSRMTQRVATLMARIEGEQFADKGRVREWLARAVNAQRDPAWTADGYVADRWMAVSPVTGALDAFQWRVPVEAVDKGDDEMLASKVEELVALGVARPDKDKDDDAGPSDTSVPPAPAKRTTDEEPKTVEAQTVRPAAKAQAPAPASDAPATGSVPPMKAARSSADPEPKRAADASPVVGNPATAPASVRAKKEANVFVAPPAPDDPGPDLSEPDDVLPLRPQRA
jgi:HemY protein